ncbi:histidinol-phosphate phosphatase [Salimicrobium flavidum]|uniref:Histidinol-phosphatase n=1 Tax=Salimicrobium flavidum TaxID=570947 RepID=A0A1N7JRU4_9BACI|nr:histidinol-phosphate phosphatase [Salimicrobium flavidum]
MRNGHIHSPFCPHGSDDSLEAYVESALQSGYTKLTFTEHAPLPEGFSDPAPDKDSAMTMRDLERYLKAVEIVKEKYKRDIVILTGLEIDFIKGYEEQTRNFLNNYGPHLEDSILSVHFLQGETAWHCIDFSPAAFEEATKDVGGTRNLYEKYFRQIALSARADLGEYKPGRIGHMSLIRKFHQLYPSPENWESMASDTLPVIKSSGMFLDYNGAGCTKEFCKETYPPISIAREAYETGIPLVYGSDAHTVSGLNAGSELIDGNLLHSND